MHQRKAVMEPPPQPPAVDNKETISKLLAEVGDMKSLIKAMQESLGSDLTTCCSGCGEGDPPMPPGPSTSVNKSAPKPGLCAVFGDPHFMTFDGAHTVLFREATLWLVKSEDVWIQGLAMHATGDFMGFAVGGPFLLGHTLVVYNGGLKNSSAMGELRVLFDGQPILADVDEKGNAEFQEPFILWAARRAEWTPSLHEKAVLDLDPDFDFDFGPWADRFEKAPADGVYLFRLAKDVVITVTSADFMSLVLKMKPEADGQSGFCGNFNGDADDDFEPAPPGSVPPSLAPAWNRAVGEDLEQVPDAANLFKLSNLSADISLLAATVSSMRRQVREQSMRLCMEDRVGEAHRACSHILDWRVQAACVTDVCATGRASTSAASAYEAEEILERVMSARSVPIFLGHGQCLDSKGRPYRTLRTEGIRTGLGCLDLLRDSATAMDVLGAQLQVSGSCELLIAPQTAASVIQGLPAPASGGWAAEGGNGRGEGTVARVLSDLSWKCWKLN